MNRFLSLLLTIAMCALLLAGCGGGDKPAATTVGSMQPPVTTAGSTQAAATGTTQAAATTASTTQAAVPTTVKPEETGEVFDAGRVKAVIPEGWKAFGFTDNSAGSREVFSYSSSSSSPATSLNLIPFVDFT